MTYGVEIAASIEECQRINALTAELGVTMFRHNQNNQTCLQHVKPDLLSECQASVADGSIPAYNVGA